MNEREVHLGEVAWIDASIVDPTRGDRRDLPHVSGDNIISLTGELVGVKSVAEDGMESGKYLFDAGDVLYSKLRPYLRKAALPEFSGLCSADIDPLKTHARMLPAYLESFHICAPDRGTQRGIVRALEERLNETTVLREALDVQEADLAALPQSLLAQAFGSAA